MLEGELLICEDPVLVEQMRATRGVILPSGGERIEVQRTVKGHGDKLSAVILAASIALENPAQAEWVEPAKLDEGARLRAEAEKAVRERARRAAAQPGALERRLRAVR